MRKQLFQLTIAALMPMLLQAQEQPVPTPQWRPVYHFTAEKNWLNDPNGLIYLNGVYHMYYQHNPFENKWGHMSWGHATSRDLLHWQHLPVAIPEIETKDTTTMIFSGSAVWDEHNTSGFGKHGKGAIVAIYTGHQPKQGKESQFIAYSNDGGLTYTNYTGNPVVDINKGDFRDPSVIWLEDQRKWLMTVAEPGAHKILFYSSANLKEWELLSEFSNQGDTRKIWECPSLTPMYVDGDPAKKKWVLMISSGNPDAQQGLQYFTGDFDGRRFINDNPAESKLFIDYGKTFYAAIPFNHLPGNKQTMIGWLVPFETPTHPWRGQMSIPRDMLLKHTPQGVRLYQQPAAVITSSLVKLPAAKRLSKKQFTVTGGLTLNNTKRFHSNAYWLDATFATGGADEFGFRIAQQKNGDKVVAETVIGYNAQRQELYITQIKDGNVTGNTEKMAVSPEDGKVRLQVLFDKSSLEVFVNGGEKVLTTLLFPAENATGLTLFAKGAVQVDTLKGWDLGK
ncbi:glycoside hydrolase family 32 protein [Chitinophaga defluvii]|uniref:Glycoside hydrolase family 32 protein n=1 Tax=Chitinophaga defluvii TaxID=3163343 RepID=A0ABV2TBH6_9BACT